MSASDEEIDDALDRLDAGLELVVAGGDARWRLPGREAIRFEVDRDRALRLLRSLSDRFHTRHPSGRHVLTPEPRVPEDTEETSAEAVLYRRWHTMKELATIGGVTRSGVYEYLMEHEDELVLRRLPARGNALIVRTSLVLVGLLEDYCGLPVVIDVDETLDVRTPAPQEVTLTQIVYTYEELGDLVARSPDAVASMVARTGLDPVERPRPGPGTQKVLFAKRPLAEAMADYWDLDVSIDCEGPGPFRRSLLTISLTTTLPHYEHSRRH